jgi:hypothetical protein
MMAWMRSSILSFGGLLVLGILVFAMALFMPELRRRYVFAPVQATAEVAVMQIASRERAFRHKTGGFAAFTVVEAPARSQRLGLNWNRLPSGDFQFDAALLPDGHLRLRALPRGDSVRALRTPAQIYAAEFSPEGAMLRSRWLP